MLLFPKVEEFDSSMEVEVAFDTPVNNTTNINKISSRTATASIFVPRTKEMNKGFLMFCEDQPGQTGKFWIIFLWIGQLHNLFI